MLTRAFRLVALIGSGVVFSYANSVSYHVAVNTAGFTPGTPGYIDIQFNQANIGALDGTATIQSWSSAGYVYNDSLNISSSGVTGDRNTLPVIIPNNVGGVNYFVQGVTSFGSFLDFFLTLAGPVVGGTGSAPSQFSVFLEDGTGVLIGGAEVASILFNPDGTTTTSGSTFSGGFATVSFGSPVPEPTWPFVATILGAVLRGRIKFSRSLSASGNCVHVSTDSHC